MSRDHLKLMGILVPVFVVLIGWGVSLTSRQETQENQIKSNENQIKQNNENHKRLEDNVDEIEDKIDENFIIIQEKLDKILYQEIQNR